MDARTRIVATLGPASEEASTIRRLLAAGVDVARLNFSHGTHAGHERMYRRVREAARRLQRPVAVLADLGGPKIRTGELPDDGVTLRRGDEVRVVAGGVADGPRSIPVSHPLAGEVEPGARVLIDEGRIELRVTGVEAGAVVATVRVGGSVTARRGVNVPGADLSLPSLTEKDRDDLAFALSLGVDWVGLSFVRRSSDVEELREEIARAGADARIVAKVETEGAVRGLREIADVADAVMVARGDLGVEIGPERVPVVQKEAILAGLAANRPVITATQMLESMREERRPTRAEASDVANAVFDGSDAVMLSGETSIGRYPVEAVRMMSRIVARAERHLLRHGAPALAARRPGRDFGDAIGHAAASLAVTVRARAVVAFTRTGATALRISRYRPPVRIVAFSSDEAVRRRLALVWGVAAEPFDEVRSVDEMLAGLSARLIAGRHARPGDVVVVAAGAPVGEPGRTNLVTLQRVRRV